MGPVFVCLLIEIRTLCPYQACQKCTIRDLWHATKKGQLTGVTEGQSPVLTREDSGNNKNMAFESDIRGRGVRGMDR